MNWFEKAHQELDEEYEMDMITQEEYQQALRELYAEYDDQAREAAERSYNEYY